MSTPLSIPPPPPNDTPSYTDNNAAASSSSSSSSAGRATNGSTPAYDPNSLQARIMLAQQAIQASMAQNTQQQPTSTPAIPDTTGIQNALLSNLQGSASKEAMMKQLQALQSSHAQRARLASGGSATSPVSVTTPITAPSPSASSPQVNFNISTPTPNANMSISTPTPITEGHRDSTDSDAQAESSTKSNGVPAVNLENLTPQQRDFLAQQQRMRTMGGNAAPQPAVPPQTATARPPTNGTPAVRPANGRPPPNQKQQFLQSLVTYHRQNNIPQPKAVFNGERDGSIKMGETWIELVGLFLVVMRNQGIASVMQDPSCPAIAAFANSKNFPNPLPEPVELPRHPNADPSAPIVTTTNPVQFLIAAYMVYLQGFEHHMARIRQQQAQYLNQTKGSSTARPPPPPSAPTPTVTAQSSTPINAPSPAPIAPMADASTPHASTSTIAATPDTIEQITDVKPRIREPSTKSDTSQNPGTPTVVNPKKRKKERKTTEASAPSTPLATSIPQPPPPPPERPPTPKRARYRVEYQPLHPEPDSYVGWDTGVISATFPKNSLKQPTRSVHDLEIVDMEAVLMGLRSRLPKELGYALTVLSMLSMPHPEENVGGLPLQFLKEIYMELLELIEEAAFGIEGYEEWEKSQSSESSHLSQMTFHELEQLGQEFDFGFDLDENDVGSSSKRRLRLHSRTGGSTDIVLTGINLLRNFSMLQENQAIMCSPPELFRLLSHITDTRLARLPIDADSSRPYSILELARIRRDSVAILANLGGHVDLRKAPAETVYPIFQLLSSFLSSGWETYYSQESPFRPVTSIRETPLPNTISITRALEAWCKISLTDGNREILGRIPSEEQVSLFCNLIRLFPIQKRGFEALHSIEDYLGFIECLALSVYSLVFLASQATRTSMRAVPGALAILTRVMFDTAGASPDFKNNPFNVLCRRLCETLGVLDGTVSATGGVESMSFSAGSGGGKGWSFRSQIVEKGWLATREEMVLRTMTLQGLDMPAFQELDGLCWGGGQE